MNIKQQSFKITEGANDSKFGDHSTKSKGSNSKNKNLKKNDSAQWNQDLNEDTILDQKQPWEPVPLKSRNFTLNFANKTASVDQFSDITDQSSKEHLSPEQISIVKQENEL